MNLHATDGLERDTKGKETDRQSRQSSISIPQDMQQCVAVFDMPARRQRHADGDGDGDEVATSSSRTATS